MSSSISRPTVPLVLALCAGGVAALAVAGQRVGLALCVAVLLILAAGIAASGRTRPRAGRLGWGALSAALAVQPVLRDAGWVVALDVAAALVAAAVAVRPVSTWLDVRAALLAPWRLVGGSAAVAAALAPLRLWRGEESDAWPVVRGLLLAGALVTVFGALFASADSAFAEQLDRTLAVDLDAADLLWRALLGGACTAAGGAVMRRALTARPEGPRRRPPRVPGRTELRIALGALVVLFGAFVVVQLRVLFGGADYVRSTTGLGFGDYARQGFVQLLLVVALTLGVVAVAARRRDRVARVLLGALCLLTLVVLVSAQHRLDLVEEAYGFTRVRVGGHAIVFWLATLLVLVLAAGAHAAVPPRLPAVAVAATLVGTLAFSLSDPDARIARRAVDRALAGASIDLAYLGGLSADALPELQRLPQAAVATAEVRARLSRPDGIAGFNLSRRGAR